MNKIIQISCHVWNTSETHWSSSHAKRTSKPCFVPKFGMNFFDTENFTNLTVPATIASTKSSSCYHLPNPEFDEAYQRWTTNLVTAAVNAVLSPFAVVANFLITFVIYRKAGLQTPSNLLLGSLAISDILVGFLVQPSYVAYRLVENQNGFVPCAIRMLFSIGFYTCYGVSFMTLCTISCERLMALLYHLRYHNIVNRQRVMKTVLFIWLVNIMLKLLQWAHNHIFRGIHLSLWLASLFIAVATQCRILSIVRHHQRQIQQLHSMSSTRQMQIKLAINIASIIAIYCAFNLPVLVIITSHQIVQRHMESYNVYSWAETVAFMTSTVNPLVCFWRVKTIRNAITEFLPRLRTKEKKVRELPFDNHVVLVKFRHITPP